MGLWVPKPTPYRLLVISTTIGLGTAKAYSTAKGCSFFATSIEWITGVVVFSVIFILGLFEADPPRLLACFMTSDLLKGFFRLLSLTPPEYHSDQVTDHQLHHLGRPPPMNGYHIVTSLSVSSFGILNAYLSSRELPRWGNAVDWILGVLIISCLYILGLYEKNTTNYMPYLFSADYSSIVYCIFLAIFLAVINLGGIILFSLACAMWYQLRGITGQNHWPLIYPPTLFNFIQILIWFVDRAVFYAGLLGLAGLVLFSSGRLLRPIWYHPSLIRVRVCVVRLLSPWRSKEPFLIFLDILGRAASFLLSGYFTFGSLYGLRLQWLATPSLEDSLPRPIFYICKSILLLFMIHWTVYMFSLTIGRFVCFIVSVASLFHTGWRSRI